MLCRVLCVVLCVVLGPHYYGLQWRWLPVAVFPEITAVMV